MKRQNIIITTVITIAIITAITLTLVFTLKDKEKTPEESSFVNENAFVTLNQGQLQGSNNGDHYVFYGIPYAKPPVGNLRWKKPENPEPWNGVLNATVSGTGCMSDPEHPTAPKTRSEDCLLLNIFMPDIAEVETHTPRPVMFWIHGGSWIHGYGSSPIYDGRHFVREESVIVVTINYRLGAFGFLYDGEELAGNQAIFDMMKALKWVKENIAQFYGDPDRITIFGESAGGQAVNTLLSIETDENLFQQAIVESAPWGIPYTSIAQGVEQFELFMTNLGCSNLTCAMKADSDQIYEAQAATRFIDRDMLSSAFETWTPLIDNNLLTDHPLNKLRTGKSREKSLMIGHNTGEGEVFVYGVFGEPVGYNVYNLAINGLFADDAESVMERYPNPCGRIEPNCDSRGEMSQVLGSYIFDCPARHAIRPRSKDNEEQNTYHYVFDHPIRDGIFPNTSSYEICTEVSCHGAEVVFVFGTFEEVGILPRPLELSLSRRVKKYWAQFAYTGNPNVKGTYQEEVLIEDLPCWPYYSDSEVNVCTNFTRFETLHLHTGEFDDLTPPETVHAHCDFWDSLDVYLEH